VNPILRELLGKYLRVIKLDKDIDYLLLHNLNALPLAECIKHTTSAKILLYIHNPTSPPTLRNIIGVKSKHKYNADIITKVDAVTTSSQQMQRYIRKTFGANAYVVPPGCEPSPELNQEKMKNVLVPQRISLGKRVHIIAKLLSKCNSEFYTIFAGSSHYTTAKAIRLIKKSGFKHYKVIVNPSDETLTWLYKCALCSVSIIGEPFGMYIIEAAAQGTSVVAPRHAGASELFTHGVHGFFFEHEDELSKYVDHLVSDPELAKKMGYEAWKICRKRYTWYHHVRRLTEVLHKI